MATGKELRSWQFPDDVGLQVFSPDLKFLVTHLRNGEDGLKLWNVATGKIIRTLPIRGWGVAFSPDGKRLMAQMGKTLSFWEPGSGKELRRVTINHEPYVFSKFAYCPDGKTLMSCDFWSHPRFWDAASGKEVKRFEGHDAPIVGLAFSPDGKQLASVAGQEIHLWEIAGQKEIRRFNGQVSVLQGVAFSADGRNLMSVSANHAIQIWDVASGKESRRGDQLGIIGAAAFSADRNTVALWREKNLSLWDMRTLKILREWNSSLDWNDTVAFSPDGKSLAAGGCGLIPDRDGQLLVGPDGKPKDYAIHLWDFTGRPLPRIGKHRRVVSWVTFSPDGRTLASVTWDNTIHLWEKASGLLRARWKTGDNVTTVRFSPNGRILASTNIGNYAGGHKTSPDEDWDKVRLWNVASGKEVHRFVGHRGTIQTLAFSPNGRLLASGSDDTTALVWDMEPVYRKVQTEPVQLKQSRLKELWADLSGSDGEKAYQALWKLAAASDQCLPVLQGHVRPVAFADPEQVARLVADLDSNQFATRQKAHRELEKLGVSAKPALRKSLTNKSSEEMRRRVQKLLDAPERDLPIVALRAVELLEHIGTAPARKILQSVTGGVPEAYLTQEAAASLKRLQSQK